MFTKMFDNKDEIIINGKSSVLSMGHGIIIPAHKLNCIMTSKRFKMISKEVKSRYEEM